MLCYQVRPELKGSVHQQQDIRKHLWNADAVAFHFNNIRTEEWRSISLRPKQDQSGGIFRSSGLCYKSAEHQTPNHRASMNSLTKAFTFFMWQERPLKIGTQEKDLFLPKSKGDIKWPSPCILWKSLHPWPEWLIRNKTWALWRQKLMFFIIFKHASSTVPGTWSHLMQIFKQVNEWMNG